MRKTKLLAFSLATRYSLLTTILCIAFTSCSYIEQRIKEYESDGIVASIGDNYLYKEDIHLFTSQKALLEFLGERNMEFSPEFWATIDGRTLEGYIRKHCPLCGYIITKEVIE